MWTRAAPCSAGVHRWPCEYEAAAAAAPTHHRRSRSLSPCHQHLSLYLRVQILSHYTSGTTHTLTPHSSRVLRNAPISSHKSSLRALVTLRACACWTLAYYIIVIVKGYGVYGLLRITSVHCMQLYSHRRSPPLPVIRSTSRDNIALPRGTSPWKSFVNYYCTPRDHDEHYSE